MRNFSLWMNVMNLNVFISARKIHGPIFLYIHHVFLKSTFFGVIVFALALSYKTQFINGIYLSL